MKEKTYYYKRAFLNTGKEDTRPSVIVAKVYYDKWGESEHGYFTPHLELTGCNGTYVRFALAIEDREDISFSDSMAKLTILRDTIGEMQREMIRARKDYEKQKELLATKDKASTKG
jgi:hypothetical protein